MKHLLTIAALLALSSPVMAQDAEQVLRSPRPRSPTPLSPR